VTAFKGHKYGRTNQFEIENRLQGLQEKFRVLDEDDLADALHQRLIELKATNISWMPDILALLLELSDEPEKRNVLDDLWKIQPPPPPKALTWAEIVEDDPFDETGVWDDIDYGAESSAEEYTQLSLEDESDSASEAGEATVDNTVLTEYDTGFDAVGSAELDHILKAQFWKEKDHRNAKHRALTERQSIVEVILMLSGLSTALFDTPESLVLVNESYFIKSLGNASSRSVLEAFAEIGSQILQLQSWISREQTVPVLQTLSAALGARLRVYKLQLSELQRSYTTPRSPITVSLTNLESQVLELVRPVIEFAGLIRRIDEAQQQDRAWTCLEQIFDRTCTLQAIGELNLYEQFGSLFFQCFETYLKSITAWMERGELDEKDGAFFIRRSSHANKALSSLWYDHFELRKTSDAKFDAPSFIQSLVQRIFVTGKSVIFLDKMHKHESIFAATQTRAPKLDFGTITSGVSSLVSFNDLFVGAFEHWVLVKQRSFASTLRRVLEAECNLWSTLDTIEYAFLMKDGCRLDPFLTYIFDKLDRANPSWNDRFVLTNSIHEILEDLQSAESSSVSVRSRTLRSSEIKKQNKSVKVLENINFEYALTWPIANIIQRSSVSVYQSVFTLLLQVQRAKHVLERSWIVKRPISRANDSASDASFYSLRFRLLWFINTMHRYLTTIVLSPCTSAMRSSLAKALDIDAMINAHKAYIEKIAELCFLSKNLAPIHSSIIALFDLALQLVHLYVQNSEDESVNFALSTRSIPASVSIRSGRSRRPRRAAASTESDSDEEDEDSDMDLPAGDSGDEKDSRKSQKQDVYAVELNRMNAAFIRNLGFVHSGVKGISRAGGDVSWELLADVLDWHSSKKDTLF
jgi:gamma-tubulin complex component 5